MTKRPIEPTRDDVVPLHEPGSAIVILHLSAEQVRALEATDPARADLGALLIALVDALTGDVPSPQPEDEPMPR